MSETTAFVKMSIGSKEVFTAVEAPTANGENERTIQQSNSGVNVTLNSTTTPKVEKPGYITTITIGGSPTTIDLTALAVPVLLSSVTRTVDMTGKNLVAFELSTPITNAAAVNVAPAGSNPYPIFGTGNDIDLKKGMFLCGAISGVASTMPDVASDAKGVTFDGTLGDKINVRLYFGT